MTETAGQAQFDRDCICACVMTPLLQLATLLVMEIKITLKEPTNNIDFRLMEGTFNLNTYIN